MTNSTVNCQPDTLEAMLDAMEANLKIASASVRMATASSDRVAGYARRKKAQMDQDTQIAEQMHTARMRAEETK